MSRAMGPVLSPKAIAMTAPNELELSVVIPTRDRRERLAETLEALVDESSQVRFELIVVHDGGTDSTVEMLESRSSTLPFPLQVLDQTSQGPAAARNRGVRAARSPAILFLGDDTRPTPGTLRLHLETLDQTGCAVQGHIDWDPEQEITPLMSFLAPAGPQFYFKGLEDGHEVPFTAVLGSNLCAPRQWLLDEPFDQRFPFAAVEDTEMAWRWYRRGWAAVYAAKARCLHHHRYDDLGSFLQRQRRAGVSIRFAVRRHPRLLWPLLLQPALFSLWIPIRALLGKSRTTDGWDLACRKALIKGFLWGVEG